MRIRFALLLAASLCSLECGTAQATSCSIIDVTGLSFGLYDPSSNVDTVTSGTFDVNCSGTPATPIVISLGQGGSGSYAARNLSYGQATLVYNLYLDPGHVSIWGDGTAGTSTLSMSPPSGTSAVQTIYGKIPASQIVAAGAYADTLVMTVSF